MSSKPKSKRRIMRHFKLAEISAVDKPAQEGATATLMKRKDAETPTVEGLLIKCFLHDGAVETKTLAKSVSSVASSGLEPYFKALNTSLHSIVADGTLSDVYKLEMMKSSASEFLKYAKQKVPDIEKYLKESLEEGQEDMNLRQLQKQMNQLGAKLDTIAKMAVQKQGTMGAAGAGGATQDDAAAERLRAMLSGTGGSAPAEKADEENEFEDDEMDKNALMGYPDETMKPGSTMKADDTEPGAVTTEGEEEDVISSGSSEAIGEGDGGADPEVSTDETEKRQTVGKRALGKRARVRLTDDTVNINGEVFSKRQVGNNLFTVLKSQQDRIDELAKSAQEEKDLRELLEFAKVAEDNLQHLPGTIEQKAGLLKSLNKSLDNDERALISKMLHAGNGGVGAAFKTLGSRGDEVKKAAGNFTKRIDEIRGRDSCTRTEAMQKARKEFPDEFAAYQGN